MFHDSETSKSEDHGFSDRKSEGWTGQSVFGGTAVTSPSVFGGASDALSSTTTPNAFNTIQSNPFGTTLQSRTQSGSFGVTAPSFGWSGSMNPFGGGGTGSFGRNDQGETLFGTNNSTKSSVFGGGTDKTLSQSTKDIFGEVGGSNKDNSNFSATTNLFGKSLKDPGGCGGSNEGKKNVSATTTLFGKSQKEQEPQSKAEDQSVRGLVCKPVSDSLFGKVDAKLKKPAKRLVNEQGEGQEGEQDGGSRRLVRRRSSVTLDDLSSRTVIVCKNVPAKLNNVIQVKKHFAEYGKVTRVYPHPRKQMATIHFADHESARSAKSRGRYIDPSLEPMQIFWSSYKPTSPGQKSSYSAEVKTSRIKEHVSDELKSMAGTSDVTFGESRSLPRDHSPPRQRPKSRSPGPRARSPSPKPPSPSPFTTSKTADLKVTLRSLADSAARTSQEKYEIMLNSDKLVREALGLHMKKQTELSEAKQLTATCQDMCPEKERYQREYQRRLSTYETLSDTDQVDHSRAVKEYSRSSADQDLPLPNELRPPHVLDKTMIYLLNNIADDGGDGKWADWFDFLWNRTRSIRKEITQLQICDLTAVSLVEKCARFHIFCSERLCEEDMMVFDSKINNENLTKCLQTLKEMYSDLETKQGIQCANEAEFRAYIVLMNLNEGDVLRDVQQLRQEILESPDLRFVLSVHTALSSHNYIRFFKLVARANFLSACVMHRYFSQVRANALHIMSKAYKNNLIPVSEVQRLLLFESEKEICDFCCHHGLSIQDEQVNMDKHSLITPEQSFPVTRAVHIIESKQHTSVGEALNGGPLPPNVINKPACSFTPDGHFITSSLPIPADVLQGTKSNQSTTVPKKPVVIEEEKAPAKLTYNNDVVKDIAKELFIDVIKDISTNMATTFVKAINVYLQKAEPTLNALIDETLSGEISSVAKEAVADLQRDREQSLARQRAEQSMSEDRACQHLAHDLVDVVATQCVQEVALQQYKLVEEELKSQRIERCTEEISTDLLLEVLEEECESAGAATYQTDVTDRLQLLEDTATAVQLLVKARFFSCWKNRFAAQLRLQKSMVTFPPAPSMKSVKQQVEAMLPESEGLSCDGLHLGYNAHLTLMSPAVLLDQRNRLQKSLMLQDYWRRVRYEKVWASLDLPHIVGQQLLRADRAKQQGTRLWNGKVRSLYWKLVVSVPDPRETDDITRLWCKWLSAKLSRGTVPKTELPQLMRLLSLYHSDIGPHERLGLCVLSVTGTPSQLEISSMEAKKLLQATSAILFVLSKCPEQDEDSMEEFWINESSRLQVIVKQTSVMSAQPPLVVIAPFSGLSEQVVSECLGLKELVQKEFVSASKVIIIKHSLDDSQTKNKVISAIQELACRCHHVALPRQQKLQDFVEDVIYEEFFTVVYENLAERKSLGMLHQSPCRLLKLYNSVVDHIADVVAGDYLTQVSWPIPEFADKAPGMPDMEWNSSQQLQRVRELVLELSLPHWEEQPTGQWGEQQVWAYLNTVQEQGANNPAFYSKMKNLLLRTRQSLEERCLVTLREDHYDAVYLNMPWTDIIVTCVHYRLNTLHSLGIDELDVYYFEELLKQFSVPVDWLNAVTNNQQQVPDVKNSLVRSVKRKYEDVMPSRSPKYRAASPPMPLNVDPETPSQLRSRELGHDLDTAVSNEKNASTKFEAYLEKEVAAGVRADTLEDFDSCVTSLEVTCPLLLRRLSAPVTSFYSPRISKSVKYSRNNPFYSPTPLSKSADRLRPSLRSELDSLSKSVSVTDKLELLDNSLKSHKQANSLFEMKLQSFLDMDKF